MAEWFLANARRTGMVLQCTLSLLPWLSVARCSPARSPLRTIEDCVTFTLFHRAMMLPQNAVNQHATQTQALLEMGITFVLTVNGRPPAWASKRYKALLEARGIKMQHACVDVEDDECEDITPFFAECFAAIDRQLDAGHGILVHCTAGRSRSATVAIAYLVARSVCVGRVGDEIAVHFQVLRGCAVRATVCFMYAHWRALMRLHSRPL